MTFGSQASDGNAALDGHPPISILLATYNGERYVTQLLDSLFAQTRSDFVILVSDGGSTDRTMEIVARYAERYPDRFELMPPSAERLGAARNFARLIDAATTPYVLFCDQDDVWLPEKIEMSMARLQALEARHGADVPLLVHGDLIVTDDVLVTTSPSFVRMSGIDPERKDLSALLFRNIATGCTIAANQALYRMARPIPPEAVMHDHWLAQVAAAFGHIGFIEQPMILYRQHGSNAIGAAASLGASRFLLQVYRVLFGPAPQIWSAYSRSSHAFFERYGDRLSPAERSAVEIFGAFGELSTDRQIMLLKSMGSARRGWLRSAGLRVLLIRLKLTRLLRAGR